MTDTIAAIATPPGAGGIGIVRMSGPESFRILARIFFGPGPSDPSGWRGFTAHYGWVKDDHGATVDEVLVIVMRSPRSYTTEDVVEINGHGGPAALRAVLDLCLTHGARLAEPGEFTRRAFLNGRIDLVQAEAVMDIVTAGTEAALRSSGRQLKGDLSRVLDEVREDLMSAYTALEAFLNFPEDDTDAGQDRKIREDILHAAGRIDELVASARGGILLKDGLKVVICGKPNAGKSSLLNALLRVPRAIVTDIAGTTRDVIEETAVLDGVPVRLMDTAGILVPRDRVEEEAVRRSRLAMADADLVLLVIDGSGPLEDVDSALLRQIPKDRLVVVVNKTDLPGRVAGDAFEGASAVCFVSALTRQGIGDLEQTMTRLALGGHSWDQGLARGALVNNRRHLEALREARAALTRGLEALPHRQSLPGVSEELRTAVRALDRITGRDASQDLVDGIFSKFCIGK